MKKLLLLLVIFAHPGLGCQTARAESSGTVKSDGFLQKAWEWSSSKDNFHLLDNLVAATFYDFSRREYLTGGTTAIYHPKGFSLDIGIAKSMESGQNALPVFGVKLHGRDILEMVGQHKIAEFLNLKQGVLKYGTGGIWYARDFFNGYHRYGAFVGAKLDF